MTAPPAMSWSSIIAVLLILATLSTWFAINNDRIADCRSLGGDYFPQTSQCIRDGRIVIQWNLGQRTTP